MSIRFRGSSQGLLYCRYSIMLIPVLQVCSEGWRSILEKFDLRVILLLARFKTATDREARARVVVL